MYSYLFCHLINSPQSYRIYGFQSHAIYNKIMDNGMSMYGSIVSYCKGQNWNEIRSLYFQGWIHRLFQIKVFILFPFVFNRLSEVAPYLRGGVLQQRVVLDGNRLELTCLAGGSWPLQYRWTLNHSNITDWTPQYRSVSTGCLRSPLSAWVFIWLTLLNPVSILPSFFPCPQTQTTQTLQHFLMWKLYKR